MRVEFNKKLIEHKIAILTKDEELSKYLINVSGFERTILGVIKVYNKQQVVDVVKIANEFKISLYPISQGKNWGLGSKLPVTNDSYILDLSGMNKIVDVSEEYGYALIEPGVTQGDLSDFLIKNNSQFYCDATGSSKSSSIIGNALERGVAYHSLRADQLISLEVVLGNGEVLKTGFSHYEHSKLSYINKYGVGPSLKEIFIQSNFGIIVSASFSLLPKPGSFYKAVPFFMPIEKEKIFSIINPLKILKRNGVITGIIHIANHRRKMISFSPTLYNYCKQNNIDVTRNEAEQMVSKNFGNGWLLFGSTSGLPKQVDQSIEIASQHLSLHGKLLFQTKIKQKVAEFFLNQNVISGKPNFSSQGSLFWVINQIKLMRLTYGAFKTYGSLATGIPTNEALRSIYWPRRDSSPSFLDPDSGDVGILFCCPIIPMSSDNVKAAMDIVEKVQDLFCVDIAVTLNTMDDKNLEGVLSIDFDKKNDSSRQSAHYAISFLNRCFIEKGFIPYRLNINDIKLVINQNDSFWRMVQAIKKTIDPHGIISPGRYSAGREDNQLLSKIIDPRSFEKEQLSHYINGMYNVFVDCFDVEDNISNKENFYKLMMNPDFIFPTNLYWQLFQNNKGDVVGFQNISYLLIEDRKFGLDNFYVLRVKIALMKAYRSNPFLKNLIYSAYHFIMDECKIKKPDSPLVVLSNNIHPNAFLMACRLAEQCPIFPNLDGSETPDVIKNFIFNLRNKFTFINSSNFSNVHSGICDINPKMNLEEKEAHHKTSTHEVFRKHTGMRPGASLISASFHNVRKDNILRIPETKQKDLNYDVSVYRGNTQFFLRKEEKQGSFLFKSPQRFFSTSLIPKALRMITHFK